jgi:hypothetical protein
VPAGGQKASQSKMYLRVQGITEAGPECCPAGQALLDSYAPLFTQLQCTLPNHHHRAAADIMRYLARPEFRDVNLFVSCFEIYGNKVSTCPPAVTTSHTLSATHAWMAQSLCVHVCEATIPFALLVRALDCRLFWPHGRPTLPACAAPAP